MATDFAGYHEEPHRQRCCYRQSGWLTSPGSEATLHNPPPLAMHSVCSSHHWLTGSQNLPNPFLLFLRLSLLLLRWICLMYLHPRQGPDRTVNLLIRLCMATDFAGYHEEPHRQRCCYRQSGWLTSPGSEATLHNPPPLAMHSVCSSHHWLTGSQNLPNPFLLFLRLSLLLLRWICLMYLHPRQGPDRTVNLLIRLCMATDFAGYHEESHRQRCCYRPSGWLPSPGCEASLHKPPPLAMLSVCLSHHWLTGCQNLPQPILLIINILALIG